LLSSFEGVGKDVPFSYDNTDKFRVRVAPPDTNGAVGDTQYIQWVNASFAVFDKQGGKVLYGPAEGRTIWQNFDAGACENNNDGDPIVQYDKINKRWILAQFAISNKTDPSTGEKSLGPPYTQCVAVSKTSDALGKYRRFSFTYDFMNDFPKMGVWLDGYYTTFNMFEIIDEEHSRPIGPLVCVYDKDVMLGLNVQRPASQQCVQLPLTQESNGQSATYYSLPADIDGSTTPAAGTPNYLLSLDPGASLVYLWEFHVDWKNAANSTFTGPVTVKGVDPFDVPCSDRRRGDCIKQKGTDQRLESLNDRLSYRLAYRRMADHEALVFNHLVASAGGGAAIRWYEMRSPFNQPAVYQSGTFAPDANSRWIATMAMDKEGNIGLAYTVSGSALSPALYFTGHRASDPKKGQLEKETLIVNGRSQMCQLANGKCADGCGYTDGSGEFHCIPGVARWGDYSSLSLDPSDDCTMWYTAEYLQSDGGYNWNTRIARFKFKSCH
jgi:hypothetical protein